ncbi:pyruvate ferredoxin oxidoreductase [Desulfovibrio sulfodismutans]|uniref:Pyruvate ferredoxin oxidoreductase n=1 Tax=Desulfolutivibrio sulfodismutans TaxID=63561 RepID=A0A7K3NKK8_9BACT|nr:pyruvate ferredoxin oxidoreductase [Desulfolutivibrio sulfodismutans]NDY56736.1 pyruvate ferredoxin oxidoreductase [Desulfolutivibrio sulfodismutans]QLA14006.1 pyruvate ferredoxin oxidoreductase [Desulfolutivibrio sulfodismutans DSM 3696]
MGKRVGLEVSLAVAEAVKLANVDVVSAYPITPQTHIVEELSIYVANGELDAEFIPVESEHSAMSAALGAATAGARVYTATASQGLALMHEILFIVSGMRMPLVMTVANRALSAPISIWNDHGDIMAERDIGWVQIFAENGQEALDLTLCAFKIAEDKRVLLPMIVNIDGFTLSHVIEPVIIPDHAEVDAFLPPYTPVLRLDTENPVTFGPVGVPEMYTEARKQLEQAIIGSKPVVEEVLDGFGAAFDRHYKLVEQNGKPGAKTRFVTMGSLGETCMTAVDELVAEGQDAGQTRIRLWRPFPEEEFLAACAGAERLVVIDRALSPGAVCGPVASELKSLFYGRPDAPEIVNLVAGLGGRDVTVREFKEMFAMAVSGKLSGNYTMWGVESHAS